MTRADRLMQKAMGRAPEGEKWPRLQVDVPPDVMDEIGRAHV